MTYADLAALANRAGNVLRDLGVRAEEGEATFATLTDLLVEAIREAARD